MVRFSGYIESKCNPVRQFEGLRYSAGSDDVVVADDDGAGFHDQHQNDAKSAVVAPFWLRSLKSDQGGLAAEIPFRHLGTSLLLFKLVEFDFFFLVKLSLRFQIRPAL